MEKKIVCIKDLPNGEHHVENLEQIMVERVDWKVALLFKQYCGQEATVHSEFLVNVKDGVVTSMTLAYTMDDAKDEDDTGCLEATCNGFFNLYFERKALGSVAFLADNVYEMARLTQALEFATVWIGYEFRPFDVTMSVEEARQIAKKEEEEFYRHSEEDEIECDYEEPLYDLDEHHIAYSKDGKTLMFAKAQFEEPEYRAHDGVEEIADFAFAYCMFPVRLLVPRTVKRIGDNIFGIHGGHIELI